MLKALEAHAAKHAAGKPLTQAEKSVDVAWRKLNAAAKKLASEKASNDRAPAPAVFVKTWKQAVEDAKRIALVRQEAMVRTQNLLGRVVHDPNPIIHLMCWMEMERNDLRITELDESLREARRRERSEVLGGGRAVRRPQPIGRTQRSQGWVKQASVSRAAFAQT